MKNNIESYLGFDYIQIKNGDLIITHHGRHATFLRGKKVKIFLQKIQTMAIAEQQQYMARLTGNYKRGNERKAKNHPRNQSF